MSETSQPETSGGRSPTVKSPSTMTSPPRLKKQITYAGGLAERRDEPGISSANSSHHNPSVLHRTNSIKEEHEPSGQHGNQHTVGASGGGGGLGSGAESATHCFLLHRSNEIENLTDQDLELGNGREEDLGAGGGDSDLQEQMELFAGAKAHLKRTAELENLNDINND